MRKHLLATAIMSFLCLAYSTSAMADLKPFHKSVGDDYYCGYKDKVGKVVVPANKYDGCGDFSDGLAYVGHIVKPLVEYETGGYKYVQGFIDQTGKLVIPVKYEVAESMMGGGYYQDFTEGLVPVYNNSKYGYMNKQQKLVIPHKYEQAVNFSDGVAVVLDEGLHGVIDKDGKFVVPLTFKYNDIGSFSEDLGSFAIEKTDGTIQHGFMDKKGVTVIKPKWGYVFGFSEGLAVVRLDSANSYKWGVINTKGDYVVEPKHDEVFILAENDEFSFDGGYYKEGKMFVYDYVNPKKRFQSKVTRNTIDKTGKIIASKTYNNREAVITEYEKLHR